MKLPDGVVKFDPVEHADWRSRTATAALRHRHGPRQVPHRIKIAGKPGGPVYNVNAREVFDPHTGEIVDGDWAPELEALWGELGAEPIRLVGEGDDNP